MLRKETVSKQICEARSYPSATAFQLPLMLSWEGISLGVTKAGNLVLNETVVFLPENL